MSKNSKDPAESPDDPEERSQGDALPGEGTGGSDRQTPLRSEDEPEMKAIPLPPSDPGEAPPAAPSDPSPAPEEAPAYTSIDLPPGSGVPQPSESADGSAHEGGDDRRRSTGDGRR